MPLPTTPMNKSSWQGVIPAITTPFIADLSLDLAFFPRHAERLIDAGCSGIVTPGSLGEGSTLSFDEKLQLWKTLVQAIAPRAHAIAAIASACTREAVGLAKAAEAAGCTGLMVLPPYIYKGSWRETRAHLAAVLRATPLSCMLYNNPLAYGTDLLSAHIAELAREHENLHAVKESSADVRRITALRELVGDRLSILVGVDDLVVEGVAAGATGWIAGLVNALPRESIRLFRLTAEGQHREADALYRWFLPLLRLDTTHDFVQLIKLVQAEVGQVGQGGPITRPPRLLPEGDELARVQTFIRGVLRANPS
jgi:1-pyrroline-4-hydroxy-2-carboxylate deaminase